MNGKSPDIRVVEIEVAERSAIGEGCKIRRRTPARPDDRGRTGHGKRNLAADTDGSFLAVAHVALIAVVMDCFAPWQFAKRWGAPLDRRPNAEVACD